MLRLNTAEHFNDHATHRTVRSEASSSSAQSSNPAGPSASSFSVDSSNLSTAKGGDDAVPVYAGYEFRNPDDSIVIGVDMKHIAEDTILRAEAKARKEIADSDLPAEAIGVVHQRIAGRQVFARDRPSVEDLVNVVASHTERLVLDNKLPAERRSYFRELVAEQCEARSALCGQRHRSSKIKAAVSGVLSLPAVAAAGYSGARTFAPIHAAAAIPPAPASALYNNNRHLLDHTPFNNAPGSRDVGQYGLNSPATNVAANQHSYFTAAFSLATMLAPSFASYSATHAFLATINGRQATIYRDLAASLRTTPMESV